MGLGRPRFELSRLRIQEPRLNIVPLSVDEVARFWSSFRNARDLAIVGPMLLQGLRSVEVMTLNRDDVWSTRDPIFCSKGFDRAELISISTCVQSQS